MKRYTLGKDQKLKSPKAISALFRSGNSLYKYPLKLKWSSTEESSKDQNQSKFAVTVPKRKFKSAVKRNRIKRLVREAYRLNRPEYIPNDKLNCSLELLFMYIADKEETLETITKAIQWHLQELQIKNCNEE